MAQDTALLRYLLKWARRAPGSWSQRDLAFAFDWTNDYISSNGNLWTGVAVKWTDWTWVYVQCYNTGFDIWTIAIDNRSVQTIKWRGSFDSFANTPFLFGYWGWSYAVTAISMVSNGKIQVEVQGTWSARIQTSNTFSVWVEYNIIVRINNTLPSWTARVVGDIDIFVDWVKQTLWITVTWSSAVTSSQVYWGAYSTTLGMTGKMRSLDIWNVALNDTQCGTEGVNSTVINITGLINSYTPSNVWVNIWRTGYDMNVSWNVSTGSDGDGSYIWFNGNRDAGATWTEANIWWSANTTPAYTQADSFTIKVKFKFSAFPASGSSGLFWSSFDAVININSWSSLVYWLRGSSTVLNSAVVVSINTLYDGYLVYNSATTKFYGYLWTSWGPSTLLNVGWTTWPATFTTNAWSIWDAWHASWSTTSCNKYIYHAVIRNKALTQAEIDADIALWNATKQDPSIVAYYIPENLTYNTQWISNPKALNAVPRASTGSSSVTANTTIAPDWTTTADTVTINWTALEWVQQLVSTISWSNIASKTFIVKAFVKVPTGTALFRLKCTHGAVADYFSSNLTATTTRQEFTFTQTFTSSTSWTWIIAWIVNSTWPTNPILEVRNVRLFLVNETLRDESPNIWWFIWWKTQKVLSCRVKPNSDTTNTSTAWGIIYLPWCFLHDRGTSHTMIIRYDDRIWARQSSYTVWWAWFRNKVHVLWLVYWTWSARWTKLYINWVLQDSDTYLKDPSINVLNTSMRLWRNSSTYFAANIRDARIYTFTWSFTDADALAIYNGGEPTSSWITKYLHYRPPVGEVGTTTQDQSTNDRDWTLNGWVTRDYI